MRSVTLSRCTVRSCPVQRAQHRQQVSLGVGDGRLRHRPRKHRKHGETYGRRAGTGGQCAAVHKSLACHVQQSGARAPHPTCHLPPLGRAGVREDAEMSTACTALARLSGGASASRDWAPSPSGSAGSAGSEWDSGFKWPSSRLSAAQRPAHEWIPRRCANAAGPVGQACTHISLAAHLGLVHVPPSCSCTCTPWPHDPTPYTHADY